MKKYIFTMSVVILAVAGFVYNQHEARGAEAVPVVTSVSPFSGPVGTSVTITGSGFTTTGNRVKFGDLGSENNPQYSLHSSDGRTLVFTVPSSNYLACWSSNPACDAPAYLTQPDTYLVSVINSNGTSNVVRFVVTVDSSSPLTITTGSELNKGVVGQKYFTTISATGGRGSYVWSLASGSLPPGLSLISATCIKAPCQAPVEILGIPTVAGTYKFEIQVASGPIAGDGPAELVQKKFTLIVIQSICEPPPACLNPVFGPRCDLPEPPGGWCIVPPPLKFLIGDRVVTTDSIFVRKTPGGNRIGNQRSGRKGTVISGPSWAKDKNWWEINYDKGVDGWSAERFLNKLISPIEPVSTVPTPLKLIRSDDSPRVYYVTEKGYKHWIPTEALFLSSFGNRWADIVVVDPAQINSKPDVTLVRAMDDAKVYKLENGFKRWITSVDAFNRNGFKWDEIVPVNTIELDYYLPGETVN